MKTSLIFCLYLICSNSVFFKNVPRTTLNNTVQQLRDIKDSNFGKKLLDTIALQIKNSAPLSDVAKLLSDIRVDLVSQKQQAKNKHQAQEAECAETIKRLETSIANNEVQRDSAEEQIELLTREISQLRVQISNYDSQVSILTSRGTDLEASRERDRKAFFKRQEQGPGVVNALNIIIEKLEGLNPTEDGTAVLAQLQKIGKLNPIASLLQISSTFSQEALDKVTKELVRLRDSISESLKEDGNDEDEAESEYKTLKVEIANTLAKVKSAKKEAKNTLKSKEGALELQNRIRDEAISSIEVSVKSKADKQLQCESWRTKWALDDKQMNDEITVIKQVEEIIATKLETVSQFVKEEMD